MKKVNSLFMTVCTDEIIFDAAIQIVSAAKAPLIVPLANPNSKIGHANLLTGFANHVLQCTEFE